MVPKGYLRPLGAPAAGSGEDAVKYKHDGKSATPFKFANGYTIAFDKAKEVGVGGWRGVPAFGPGIGFIKETQGRNCSLISTSPARNFTT